MQDRKVEVSLSLIQGIVQYLQSRPYSEVAGAIKALDAEVTPQLQPPVETPAD